MSRRATITVYRSREEVERLWRERRPAGDAPASEGLSLGGATALSRLPISPGFRSLRRRWAT